MAKMCQVWQNLQNQINKGIMRKNAFECLNLGKKLTCVKFSGIFDGIIKNT